MPSRRRDPGILSEPIDLDGPRRPRVTYPEREAVPGLIAKPRASPFAGVIVEANAEAILLRDRRGDDHWIRYATGGFEVDDTFVTLVPPPAATAQAGDGRPHGLWLGRARRQRARVARASRILVEGIHDAELVEKVWGDDLRVEGVVVEQLEGADHLASVVRAFGPGRGRRLGVLLDHLVDGSKETRLAATVDHPDVLVVGHPYVDIWQAVKPSVLGIDGWPTVPRSEPWKAGVLARLGTTEEPSRFWKRLLGAVSSWTDLEPALIGAVEQLIDFVTEPA